MLYRAMTPDQVGLPAIVPGSGRALVARVPTDIVPNATGTVAPRTGGLSVSPCSEWKIPHHRRPMAMGRGSTGPNADRVYALDFHLLQPDLFARPDPNRPTVHAFIEPSRPMQLADYQQILGASRTHWRQIWP